LPAELRKKYRKKRERHSFQVERALKDWDTWLLEVDNQTLEAHQ